MSELVLNKGGRRSVRLTSADGTLIVQRAGEGGWGMLFCLLPLALLTLVIGGGLVGVACMVWIAVTQFSWLALLVGVVLGVALLPGIYAWFVLQGLLLPFSARLAGDQYRLENGLLRLSRRMTAGNVCVKIYPTYSRGGWGYGAKLELPGRGLALPFVPKGIVGTKHDALKEARCIRDWLRQNSGVGEVILDKWGDTDRIQPGADYIR